MPQEAKRSLCHSDSDDELEIHFWRGKGPPFNETSLYDQVMGVSAVGAHSTVTL